MKIKFNQKYKSINNFTESEIQDFSVFVGKNGSGKTHLLKAINEGFVNVDDIQKDETSYFNFQNFLIRNQRSVAQRNIDDEKIQAWNILIEHKNTFQSHDNQIKQIVGEKEPPYDCRVLESQKIQYSNLIENLIKFIQNITQNNPKIRKLIRAGIFESGKYASEITQEEFLKHSNYDPDDYELLENLSEIFLDYHKRIAIAGLPKKDGGEGLNDKERQKLKEFSPWNVVNNMFKEFDLPHSITSPNQNIADLIRSQAVSFQAKLNIGDEEMDFDDLSSGEKILCSLAITVYQDNRSKFPKILLLDEVDASLHPSMIKNLLDVIENVFIKNNCKVILATHSPTTAALVREESLFEVKSGNIQNKIEKISQVNAIDVLSEGIITFEKGLKIQKDIDPTKSLQILTEGNNADHIQKAIEKLDTSLLDQVKIIKDGGGQQLKNAFDAFSNADHSSQFLFVWDCDFKDVADKIIENGNFKKFCFAENTSNTKAKDKNGKAIGIENLYSDSLFTNDVYSPREVAGSYGTTTTIKEFDKQKFLDKIKQQTENSTFTNFQPLLDKIKEILNPNN